MFYKLESSANKDSFVEWLKSKKSFELHTIQGSGRAHRARPDGTTFEGRYFICVNGIQFQPRETLDLALAEAGFSGLILGETDESVF
jgi:hypothetical protein